MRFVVTDTQKRGAAHSHIGRVAEGTIRVGDTLACERGRRSGGARLR